MFRYLLAAAFGAAITAVAAQAIKPALACFPQLGTAATIGETPYQVYREPPAPSVFFCLPGSECRP